MSDDSLPALDTAIGFTVAARSVRGRLVRIGPVLDAVLAAHAYPPPIERLLAEALVLGALLGTMLKDETGQLTMQAQTEHGAVSLLVCDYQAGALRGYVQFDTEKLAEIGPDPTLFGLFGKGFLAITFDQQTSGERYQGIVPLEGNSLADAVEHYFAQSEQIPSLARVAVTHERGEGCRAAGLLLQHLPEGEVGRERLHVRHDHPDWAHIAALGETISSAELADPALPLDDIVWRLFHDEGELRVVDRMALTKGCRCDLDRIRDVISRFPADERAAMADDHGVITVDCAFCSMLFRLNGNSLVPISEH